MPEKGMNLQDLQDPLEIEMTRPPIKFNVSQVMPPEISSFVKTPTSKLEQFPELCVPRQPNHGSFLSNFRASRVPEEQMLFQIAT